MALEKAATDSGVADGSVHDRLVSLLGGASEPLPPEDDESPVEGAEPTDEVDGEAAVGTDTDVTDDEGGKKTDDEDASDWMPQHFDELVEALGANKDDLLRMRVRTKIDGSEGEATLADLVKSYQLEGHLNRRSEQLANERKEWEAHQQRLREEYERKARDAEDTISAMEHMLAEEFQGIDWKELQEDDPTQYLLTQQRLQQRFSAIQAKKQQLRQQREQEAQQYFQQSAMQRQQILQREFGALVERIPEWRDEAKRNEGLAEVKAYIKQLGATDQEIDAVVDHRVVAMAYKAMQYDKMQSEVEPKKQKLKSKPKFVPPGARKSDGDSRAKRIEQLRKRARRGDRGATHELLMMKISK